MTEQTDLYMGVSYSELNYFGSCAKKHEYAYLRNLTPVTKSPALANGTTVHSLLEEHYKEQKRLQEEQNWNEDTKQGLFGVTALKAATSGLDAKIVGSLVVSLRKAPFADWEILAVEREDSLDLPNGMHFKYVIDLVAREPLTGQIWVIDHKTTKDFFPQYMLDLNPQLPRYVGAARAKGLKVDRAGYSMIRTGYPVKATEEEMYQFASVTLNDERVTQSFKEQVVGAINILLARKRQQEGTYTALRNVDTMGCKMCPFKTICAAEMTGQDVEATLLLNYEQKKRRGHADDKPAV